EPTGTVTLLGTDATGVRLLLSATCAPPAGAAPLSVTVPVAEAPLSMIVGFSVSDCTVSAGGIAVTLNAALALTPPYEPVMVVGIVPPAARVVTVNVAL